MNQEETKILYLKYCNCVNLYKVVELNSRTFKRTRNMTGSSYLSIVMVTMVTRCYISKSVYDYCKSFGLQEVYIDVLVHIL